MSRKLVLLLLVLGLASASYGVVIGNFEGGMDGWAAGWEGSPVLTNATAGATLGTGSLGVKLGGGGYWCLSWNAPAVPASLAGMTLQFDLTMIQSEWTGNNWTKVADKIALNSDGASGWTEWTTAAVTDRVTGLPSSADWGPWNPDALKTYSLDVSSYNPTGATWFQINIALQQNPTTGVGNFYIDNVQLVPEPATMGLLGLGGLALLRRKR